MGKQLNAEREQRAAAAMGQQTEVPDADKSQRQYVQQESAQKFDDSQRHETLFILVSRIAPAKGDGAVGERDEAMVRDRYTVGVQVLVLYRKHSGARLLRDEGTVHGRSVFDTAT